MVAIVVFVWTIVKKPFSKPKPTQLASDTIDQIKPPQAKDGPALTVPEFIRLRRELKADLEAELAEAAEAEKSQLRARIAELEKQIANPDEALAEAQKRIKDLEAILDREANQIGADRIAEAKAALEQGDYSLADEIFAEIEAKNELAVQETARAAYGRGEVAEAEVRWGDAAGFYERSAELHPSFEALQKASDYCERAGRYEAALAWSARLVGFAKQHESQERYSIALNEHAVNSKSLGRYEEAEGLYREALEIDRATIGEGHSNYATSLNNLALVVEAQGRYAEADGLYREVLAIDRATIGERHQTYAIGLNNLAVVVQAQGRYAEAERLYREALEIGRATLGEGHPDYATRLNNLAGVLVKQGKPEVARPLFEQALEIFRTTLPPDHPHIGAVEGHIANLP
ncbi:tetratricopeptide repeat protein [Roseovarius tolerans]|uniref:tetratricopeptide repeat protein n=1 Tax=Roseovarius tolerans TaxID=74031 RepID=UPI0009424A89|nr:tetratricopeptide repeat protein [Roseovarius tolerans]